MINHTPRPWQADLSEPFTLGGDSREVVALDANGMVNRGICAFMLDTDDHPNGKYFLEDVANARLIAAAPELLAALVQVQQDCKSGSLDHSIFTIEAIQAAISKALTPIEDKKDGG